jgi:hypothetical protein
MVSTGTHFVTMSRYRILTRFPGFKNWVLSKYRNLENFKKKSKRKNQKKNPKKKKIQKKIQKKNQKKNQK